MFIFENDLGKFFEEEFADLKCQPDTKAYIISIFNKYQSANFDFSDQNITLLFAQARQNHDFLAYQSCADWVFFLNSLFEEHLKFASKEYYNQIGQSSYYSCYRLINRQWDLYRELAENFQSLEFQVKNKLQNIKIQKPVDGHRGLVY